MTCRELADFVMDYLSGELPAEVHAAFDYHLGLCPDCVNYLAAYKTTVELNRRTFAADDADAGSSPDIPQDLVRAILAARRQ